MPDLHCTKSHTFPEALAQFFAPLCVPGQEPLWPCPFCLRDLLLEHCGVVVRPSAEEGSDAA